MITPALAPRVTLHLSFSTCSTFYIAGRQTIPGGVLTTIPCFRYPISSDSSPTELATAFIIDTNQLLLCVTILNPDGDENTMRKTYCSRNCKGLSILSRPCNTTPRWKYVAFVTPQSGLYLTWQYQEMQCSVITVYVHPAIPRLGTFGDDVRAARCLYTSFLNTSNQDCPRLG